jgi:hypothetical protein
MNKKQSEQLKNMEQYMEEKPIEAMLFLIDTLEERMKIQHAKGEDISDLQEKIIHNVSSFVHDLILTKPNFSKHEKFLAKCYLKRRMDEITNFDKKDV